jgi:hypothetical protein
MEIPFDVEKSETWFIELWNYTVIPYFGDLLKQKLMVSCFNFDLFLFGSLRCKVKG